MGKMGKFSVSGLEKTQRQLNKVKAGDVDAFVEGCAKELAARLLAKARERTPVGDYTEKVEITMKKDSKSHKKGDTHKERANPSGKQGGTLKKGWAIGEIRKEGGLYKIEVINPVPYASYVEYGHRQTPGRYVPAIGKQLKKDWIEGKHMLEYSEQEIQDIAPKVLEAKIKTYLEGCMK